MNESLNHIPIEKAEKIKPFALIPDQDMRYFLETIAINLEESDTYTGSQIKQATLKTFQDIDPENAYWPTIYTASERIVQGKKITNSPFRGSRKNGNRYNLGEALLYSAAIKHFIERYSMQIFVTWSDFDNELRARIGDDPIIQHLKPTSKN